MATTTKSGVTESTASAASEAQGLEAQGIEGLRAQILDLAKAAKEASRRLAIAPTETKHGVLRRVSSELHGAAQSAVLAANAKDVEAAEKAGLSAAMIDRLRLTPERLNGIARGIDEVIALPDPVGSITGMSKRPNGLLVGQMRVPLGVVTMIYESRPNVTADAAALCLKSGNACILRGGSEAFHSNRAFAAVFELALAAHDLPTACVSLVPTTDRRATEVLIQLDGLVDLVIPRGGEGLIRFVAENARVPVLKHYKGVCHVYVDAEADLEKAAGIVLNSKLHRTGVCNAMETLLVDAAVAETFLPDLVDQLQSRGCEVRGDEAVQRITKGLGHKVTPATEADWDEEYLDAILSIRVVDGYGAAVAHIAAHGSQHTEVIVTENYSKAQRFIREVDASMVLANASTRFNDGGQVGLGAEIGISTTKLHAYGPMGLNELCTQKWVAFGEGQVRS